MTALGDEELLAEMRSSLDRVNRAAERVRRQVRRSRTTVEDRDRLLSVTVDGHGDLCELTFHGEDYVDLPPAELADLIVKTVTAARLEARRKAMALLAYLAVTGENHSRHSLANLLWPEYDERRARADLRRTLSVLNKTLGQDWLSIKRDTVGLNRQSDFWLDVGQFHRLLAECKSHHHPIHDCYCCPSHHPASSTPTRRPAFHPSPTCFP